MSEYGKGNGIHVYDFDKCIAALRQRHDDQEKRIEYLEKENKELNYKLHSKTLKNLQCSDYCGPAHESPDMYTPLRPAKDSSRWQ